MCSIWLFSCCHQYSITQLLTCQDSSFLMTLFYLNSKHHQISATTASFAKCQLYLFNTSHPAHNGCWSQCQRPPVLCTSLGTLFSDPIGKTKRRIFYQATWTVLCKKIVWMSQDSVTLEHKPVTCGPTALVASKKGHQQRSPLEKTLCIRYRPAGMSLLKLLAHNNKSSGYIFSFNEWFLGNIKLSSQLNRGYHYLIPSMCSEVHPERSRSFLYL